MRSYLKDLLATVVAVIINTINNMQNEIMLMVLTPKAVGIKRPALIVVSFEEMIHGLKVYRIMSKEFKDDPSFLALATKLVDGREIVITNDLFWDKLTKTQREIIVAHEKGHFVGKHHGIFFIAGSVVGEMLADQYAADIYGKNKVKHMLHQTVNVCCGAQWSKLSTIGRLEYGARVAQLSRPERYSISGAIDGLF